jgi:hypothetical protein
VPDHVDLAVNLNPNATLDRSRVRPVGDERRTEAGHDLAVGDERKQDITSSNSGSRVAYVEVNVKVLTD